MIKTMSRMMAATAALGLVAAPIVAQANTRAGDNGAVYSASSAPGLGRAEEGEGIAGAGIGGLLLAVIGAGAVIVGVLAATDNLGEESDEDGDGSPGT